MFFTSLILFWIFTIRRHRESGIPGSVRRTRRDATGIVHSRSFPLMLLLRGSKRKSAALPKKKLCDLDSVTREDYA